MFAFVRRRLTYSREYTIHSFILENECIFFVYYTFLIIPKGIFRKYKTPSTIKRYYFNPFIYSIHNVLICVNVNFPFN